MSAAGESAAAAMSAASGVNAAVAESNAAAAASSAEQQNDAASSILLPFTLGSKRRALNTLDLEGAGFVVRAPNDAANSAATESLEHDDETVAMLCGNLEKALGERIAPAIITAIAALLPCVADRAGVILESGIVARLATFCLSRAQAASSVQLLDSAAKLFALLCKASPTPEFGPLSRALPALADMLYSSSHEQLCNAALAVATLADDRTADDNNKAGESSAASSVGVGAAASSGAAGAAAGAGAGVAAHHQIQVVVQSGVCRRLVELLSHKSSTVKAFALRAVGSICSGDDLQTQVVLAAGALPALLALLAHPMKLIRLDALWALSNILAGNGSQIQSVIDERIPGAMLGMLESESVEVRREIVLALGNMLVCASQKQVRDLVRLRAVKSLCKMLTTPDVTLQLLSLQALELLLAAGEVGMKLAGGVDSNGIALEIEDVGGLDSIEALQRSACEPVWAKAVHVLRKYFGSEEVPETEAAVNPQAAAPALVSAPASASAASPVFPPFVFDSLITQPSPFVFGSLPPPSPFDFGSLIPQPSPQWRVDWLQSPAPSAQLAATGIRKALCEDDPAISKFIDHLPTMVQLLKHGASDPQLQLELVWIVCNMASVPSSPSVSDTHMRAILSSGVVPVLVALLASANDEVAETAAWALGNIARDSAEAGAAVLRAGAVPSLAHMMLRSMGAAHTTMRINSSWALRGLLCGSGGDAAAPEFDAATVHALPALELLLERTTEPEVRLRVCEILAALTARGPPSAPSLPAFTPPEKQALKNSIFALPSAELAGIVAIITPHVPAAGAGAHDEIEIDLGKLDDKVLRELERFTDKALGKPSRGAAPAPTDSLLSVILGGKVVSSLCLLLRTADHAAMRQAALQTLGNLAARCCEPRQTQRLINQGILQALHATLSLPHTAATAPRRVLVLWTLSNLLRGASIAQITSVLDPELDLLAQLPRVRDGRCLKVGEAHNLGYVYCNLLRDCSETQLKTALDAGLLREVLALLPDASPKLLRALLESLEACLTCLRDTWVEGDPDFGASAFIEENTESLSALLALYARSHADSTTALVASMLEELFNVQPKKKTAASKPVATAPASEAAATTPISPSKPVAAQKPEPATPLVPAALPAAAPASTIPPPAVPASTDGVTVTRHKCTHPGCSKVFAAAHFLEKHKSTKHPTAAAVAAAAPASSAPAAAATAVSAAEPKPMAAPVVAPLTALPDLSALSLAPRPLSSQPQAAIQQLQVQMLQDAATATMMAERLKASLTSIAQLRASSIADEQCALCASLCDAVRCAAPAHLDAMVDHGIIEAFAHVLAQEQGCNEDSQEHAVAALGHLAASSPRRRDAVLAAGVLPSLLRLCVPIARISLLRRCVGTLASLCRRDVDWSLLSPVVPVLAQLLKMRGDEELMLHLCSAFAAISEPAEAKDSQELQPAEAARLSAVASSGAARSLVDLLIHRSLQLQSLAFVVVAQLALGDEAVLQVLLTETGLLASLRTTLAHSSPAIRAAAARVLKHATRGCSVAQMQLLFSAGLVPLLVARRRTDEVEVRSEAAGALCSMATRGDPNQIRYLVTQGVMQQLCFLLDPAATSDSDASLQLSALCGLESMLRVGALTSFEEPLLTNRFSKQLEQGEGRQAMRAMTNHRDARIQEKARAILALHFPSENPAAAAAASSSSSSSPAAAAAAPSVAAPVVKSRADDIAALRPLLLSDSADSQLRALQGLRTLLVSSPSSVLSPLVESPGLLARAVFLLLSNSDVSGVPNAAAALLGSLASLGSDSQKQLLLELSALPCLFMMLHKARGEAQRSALGTLRAMLGGSAAIVQAMLLDARLVQVLTGALLSMHPATDAASFAVCADSLCMTLVSSGDAQLRLLLQKQPTVLVALSRMLSAPPETLSLPLVTPLGAIRRVLSVMEPAALAAAAVAAPSASSVAAPSSTNGLVQLRSALLALLPLQPFVQPLLAFFD